MEFFRFLMTIHNFLTSYGEILTKKVAFSPPYYHSGCHNTFLFQGEKSFEPISPVTITIKIHSRINLTP